MIRTGDTRSKSSPDFLIVLWRQLGFVERCHQLLLLGADVDAPVDGLANHLVVGDLVPQLVGQVDAEAALLSTER